MINIKMFTLTGIFYVMNELTQHKMKIIAFTTIQILTLAFIFYFYDALIFLNALHNININYRAFHQKPEFLFKY